MNRHFRGIISALKGTRTNLKPSLRKTLERVGDCPITSIDVVRRPLSSMVKKLMRALRIGGEHDRFFHLFLVVTLGNEHYVIEKNEDLNMTPYKPTEIDEKMEVSVPSGLTPAKLFESAINRIPRQRLFHYDAFSSNCQRFVIDLLQASDILMTPPLMDFIYQDVSKLGKRWQRRLTSFFTSLANRGKMAIVGEGVVMLE